MRQNFITKIDPTIKFFTFFILLLITPSLCTGDQKFKVGFIGDLSGIGKLYGEACKNGFLMGLDSIDRSKIEVIFEDDHFETSKTVSAINKLIDFDKVNLVTVLASGPSNAVASIAESKKIPLLAWASDTKVSKGRNFVIRSYVSGQVEAETIAKHLATLNYPRIAFISVMSDYGMSVLGGLEKEILNSKIVLSDFYDPQLKDFGPFILKSKKQKVNALGVCLNPGQVGLFARQARNLKQKCTNFWL